MSGLPAIRQAGLGQGCDVIVTSCCRCNISEAEAGELKHYKSVWARGDSTGRAYFTGAEAIPLGLSPEADPEGEYNQSNVKPERLFA